MRGGGREREVGRWDAVYLNSAMLLESITNFTSEPLLVLAVALRLCVCVRMARQACLSSMSSFLL